MIDRFPTDREFEQAAHALAAGRLVAFPTETVYGLGADATNDHAVAAIYHAKGRPRFNPLIMHVADISAAQIIGHLSEPALQLAEAFWPGPLTIVVPRRPGAKLSSLATAGLETLAIRIPSHPVARRLLAAVGCPVAAPSANISGRVSATSAAHVRADLGTSVAIILDAGPTQHGMESTIVDATGTTLRLLRPGAVTREALAAASGSELLPATRPEIDAPIAPGQLASHYAPGVPLRMNAQSVRPGEALLAFGPNIPAHDGPVINLSPSGNITEAAISLFAAMRKLDATGCTGIAVMPVPEDGLGEAINDRLRRASAPRPQG